MGAIFIATLVMFSPLRADPAAGDIPPALTAAPVTDPALIAQHYHEVATRPEFRDVGGSGVKPQLEDLLSDWFRRLGKEVGEFRYTSRMPAFESMLMSLLVAFALATLIYIIYRLSRGQKWTWNESDPSSPGETKLRAPEFYDAEIAQAVAGRDWHAAWLASWRQFLSRLERRNLVEADRTRTNREYLGQLRARPMPASALALVIGMVDAYDRFIYGSAAIGEAEWNQFYEQIEEAALLLHLDDKRTPASASGITA
jgi:hypothetical protein